MHYLIFLLIGYVLLAGCTVPTDRVTVSPPRPAETQTPLPVLTLTPTETVTPIPSSTGNPSPEPTGITAVPTATPSVTRAAPTTVPSPTPIPTTSATLAGPQVSFQGIHFTLAPALAQSILVKTGPGYNQASTTLSTYFYFGEDDKNLPCSQQGQLEIHPIEPLVNWAGAGPDIQSIQERINDPLTGSFPTWGAAVLLQTPTQRQAFPGVTGIQALVMWAQDAAFASNSLLAYDFHGITADELYYVRFCYPLDAPILPEDTIVFGGQMPDSQEDEGQVLLPTAVPETWEDFFAAAKAYNEQAAIELGNLPSSSFSPNLTLLESLLASLQIKPAN